MSYNVNWFQGSFPLHQRVCGETCVIESIILIRKSTDIALDSPATYPVSTGMDPVNGGAVSLCNWEHLRLPAYAECGSESIFHLTICSEHDEEGSWPTAD